MGVDGYIVYDVSEVPKLNSCGYLNVSRICTYNEIRITQTIMIMSHWTAVKSF